MPRWLISSILFVLLALIVDELKADESSATPASWRDDATNLKITEQINRALERIPFSVEYDGVSDHCPLAIDWEIGPDLPMAWKGGVSGVFEGEIVLAAGAWLDNERRAFAFDVNARTYRKIPPPPVATSFTQGAFDGRDLYIVAGKTGERLAVTLTREPNGEWHWTDLPPPPEANRWTGAVSVAGGWLFLYTGSYLGREGPQDLRDWRLRLDDLEAGWKPMAPYPGGQRAVVISAVARGQIYVFGGWRADPVLRELRSKVGELAPHRLPIVPGVIAFRDAYRYDPGADRWTSLRSLPFAMYGGAGIVIDDRYILLMGTSSLRQTLRVGHSHPAHKPYLDQYWKGYDDVILCYDLQSNTYSRVGVMPYGVSNWAWQRVGMKLYCFGGEPSHGLNSNRETVLQIGTIRRRG